MQSFVVVNVLNRVYDTGETDPATGLKFKAVEFMFRDEPVVIGQSGPETGAYPIHILSVLEMIISGHRIR
jgi:hypothetical protein